MNIPKLSFSQLTNLILATFLLVGLAATTYSVTSLTTFQSDAKGKPGSGTTASISINQIDPHLGDSVTFTTKGGKRVSLACYQGGLNMVYSADQAVGTAFLLGGTNSTWLATGGDVLCYAWLYERDLSKGFLASTSFNAGGFR